MPYLHESPDLGKKSKKRGPTKVSQAVDKQEEPGIAIPQPC